MAELGLPRGTVRLCPYQAGWPAAFEAEAARLRALLGDPALRLEHVGSTAVPGLCAKPIIHMLAAAPRTPAVATALAGAGYEDRGDGGVPGRALFVKGPPDRRTHHLSLCDPGGAHWRAVVAFRDRLRADPAAARRYSGLKRRLAAAHAGRRDLYTAGKSAFVAEVLGAGLRT